MTDLTRARELAASAYPEQVYIERGDKRIVFDCVIRRGILSGQYDRGSIVQQHMPKEAKE